MTGTITRKVFSFPSRTPSWFAGHMARSLRELPALLDEVDLVVEARDARLPLTSVNHAFDAMLERVWGHSGAGQDRRGKTKEKIVVYTKRDLAEERYEAPLKKALWAQSRQRVLFADSRVDSDVRGVLRLAAKTAEEHGEAVTDLKVLVVGMPNVGKSSLLNALRRVGVRRGKAFHTGAMPGVTRRLTGTVRVYDKPPIYVFDTPGVMMPFLGHDEVGAERGLKLALTAGIKDGLFEPDTIADYLLYKMNVRMAAEEALLAPDSAWRHESYIPRLPLPKDFQQTDVVQEFLHSLAGRLGALKKGGEADTDASITFLLRHFREGKMGRWTLDDLDGLETQFIHGGAGPASAATMTEDSGFGIVAPSSPINNLGYVVSEMGAVGGPATAMDPATTADGAQEVTSKTSPVQEEEEQERRTQRPEAILATTTAASVSSPAAGSGSASASASESALVTPAPLSAPISAPASASASTPAVLQQRVSGTIATFLAHSAQERADAEAGRNKSSTQQKKAERKAKTEYREARMRAKGLDKRPGMPGAGPNSGFRTPAGRAAGHAARNRRR